MANVIPGVRALLEADSAVAALVGTRVYPVFVPPSNGDAMPVLVLSARYESEPGLAYLEGMATVDIECWAWDYDEAHALADAVQAELHGRTGQLGGVGPTVNHFIWLNTEDSQGAVTPDRIAFVAVLTFDVHYTA